MGLTEADFKDNPDLLDYIQHMNSVKPLEEETENMNQKQRHFKYFE